MASAGYVTRRTAVKIEVLLDNPLHLLERLNDSRATIFLLLREAAQPIHTTQIIRLTKVSRSQAYRALQFLKSIGLADELHGYWFEKMARPM